MDALGRRRSVVGPGAVREASWRPEGRRQGRPKTARPRRIGEALEAPGEAAPPGAVGAGADSPPRGGRHGFDNGLYHPRRIVASGKLSV